MTNDFNDSKPLSPDGDTLEDLLADVSDAQEKKRLIKAWQALGGLSGADCGVPKPSRELENIFREGGVDDQLSDDELHSIAAAGTPGMTWAGDDQGNIFYGEEGDDLIEGNGGNDFLFGHGGADSIDGGSGNDYIVAGSGDDTLVGGEGDDTLVGGAGGDVFIFDSNSGNDTIADFNPLEDRLQFEGVDQSEITTVFEDGNTIISFGDTTITLVGVNLNQDDSGSGGASW